ncbi:MAG: hypothetical protein HRU29_13310 [Rhizobiales bacterium]|nr:hypothetical protein [Hyphomicrobiales bacterium]NRB15371.1 hypothetical protein [Hyphomicrobiales bacterium]
MTYKITNYLRQLAKYDFGLVIISLCALAFFIHAVPTTIDWLIATIGSLAFYAILLPFCLALGWAYNKISA